MQSDQEEKERMAMEKDLARIKYHHGPIDQKALSGATPKKLMQRIQIVLKEMKMQVMPTADPFKLKVIMNPTVEDADTISVDPKVAKKPKRRLGSLIANFPLELVNRIKYVGMFGFQYNYGFDGHRTQLPQQKTVLEEPIKMYIMIHKLRNLEGLLTVDLKRSRGDIWEFKRIYQEIIQRLKLGIERQ
jgi:hypothetical protein